MAEVDDDGSGDVDFREFTEWFLQMEGSELEGLEDALAAEQVEILFAYLSRSSGDTLRLRGLIGQLRCFWTC